MSNAQIEADHASVEGPSFLKSLAWMTLSLSLATLSVGGLFFKAFEM
ncbi:MAG: hypothetical protein GY822_21230 [Deltaproteobacteria bacterium]|nr:hypothetical protein [Deltaproteobacteria bacterium]